jgi:hypothetical protein
MGLYLHCPVCFHGVVLMQRDDQEMKKNTNESYIFLKIQCSTRLQNPVLNDICSAPHSHSRGHLISTVNEKVQ